MTLALSVCIFICLTPSFAAETVNQKKEIASLVGCIGQANPGDPKKAFEIADVGVRKYPQAAELYAWRATAKLRASFEMGNGNDKVALLQIQKDMEKALSLNPNLSQAYYVRGRLKVIESNEKAAIEDLSKAIMLDPKNILARFWRAQLYEGEHQENLALQDLDFIIKIAPAEPFYVARALLKRHMKNFAGAIADYNIAEKMENKAYFYIKRGDCFTEAKLYEKAAADYTTGLTKNPNPSEITFLRMKRARVYDDLGKFAESEKDYAVILKKNPDDLRALTKHLHCCMVLKRHADALKDVNALIEFDDQYNGYFAQRAQIYRALGKTDLAEQDEKTAQRLLKKNNAPIR